LGRILSAVIGSLPSPVLLPDEPLAEGLFKAWKHHQVVVIDRVWALDA
jgi:hypothetical protein